MPVPLPRWLPALCAALWLLCPAPSPADELADKLQAVTDGPRYRQAHWGLLFVDLASGEVLHQRDADKLFAPASVTKLYSVASALHYLGAEHRFRTPVVRRGPLSAEGVLDGDLILIASGDLSLGGRTNDQREIAFLRVDHTYANWSNDAELTPQDPRAGLRELARQVAAAGVKKIGGEVLVDDRLFDRAEGTGSGPSRLTPIVVNDNVLDFTLAPTEPGQLAKLDWRPPTRLWEVENQLQTVAADGRLETWIRDHGDGRITLRGTIPAKRAPLVRIYEVPDAAAFARGLFIEELERAGIEVAARPARRHPAVAWPSPAEVAALPQVAQLESPAFAESARLILKVSHNLQASTLPLLVAASKGKRTLADGLRLQRDFLAGIGVEVDTISFGGAAGGARADFVTPAATVQLLRAMASRPDFAVFHRALPVLGVDGTLARNVGPESPARGKVQAKTGTLVWDNTLLERSFLGSKALAGYLTTLQGRKLAFAVFVNNVNLPEGVDSRRIGDDLGRICEIMHQER